VCLFACLWVWLLLLLSRLFRSTSDMCCLILVQVGREGGREGRIYI